MNDDTYPRPNGSDALTATDRVRALVEGRLGADESAAVRREIAADPELRRFFEDWSVVAEPCGAADAVPEFRGGAAPLRQGGTGRVETPRLLPTRTMRSMRPMRWAAAAALLVAAAGGAWAMRYRWFPPEIEAPQLASLSHSPAGPVALGAPRTLTGAEEDPTIVGGVRAVEAARRALRFTDGIAAAEGIQWTHDWDEATALARATGKPLLVYVHHPACPWCKSLDDDAWPEKSLVARAAEFVPVKIDVTAAPEQFADAFERGWPYIAVVDADGKTLLEFGGMRKAPEIAADVERAQAAARARLARTSWLEIGSMARSLVTAEEEIGSGRIGGALARLQSVPGTESGSAGEIGVAVSARRERLQGEARRALSSVTETAPRDADAAADAADEAARRFGGSPIGGEFAALRDALRETGVLPRLVVARR